MTRRWRQSIPEPLRRVARPLYRWGRSTLDRLTHRPKSRDELHTYWASPPEAINAPASYVEIGHGSSEFLVELVRRHAPPGARILEIGCNAGRNLDHLFRAGFTNLSAIEISQGAIDTFRSVYPATAAATTVHLGPVEEQIRGLDDRSFDLVFTMAVLEHIHEDSNAVFAEIARVTRGALITIEDEREYSDRTFPRNYRRVFEPLGLEQVEEIPGDEIPDLFAGFVGRVFTRNAQL